MICLLRRERRCLAVKGAGAGGLTGWGIAGGARGGAHRLVQGRCDSRGKSVSWFFDSCKRNPVHDKVMMKRKSDFDSANYLLPPVWNLFGKTEEALPPLASIWATAHVACSAIKGSGSWAARCNAGISERSPTLPRATHTLRRNPRRVIRFIREAF